MSARAGGRAAPVREVLILFFVSLLAAVVIFRVPAIIGVEPLTGAWDAIELAIVVPVGVGVVVWLALQPRRR